VEKQTPNGIRTCQAIICLFYGPAEGVGYMLLLLLLQVVVVVVAHLAKQLCLSHSSLTFAADLATTVLAQKRANKGGRRKPKIIATHAADNAFPQSLPFHLL